MCEIPSNVILAEEFAQVFDGFSIGSNDLTQLVLGVDRDSELVAHLFDERNEAVTRTIAQVIATALAAGIRVVMITGDHPATALAVAHLIGIPGVRVLTGEDLDDYAGAARAAAFAEVNVFARVRPEQKLQIVEGLQAQGQIVAMTGDGVNDAPALKRSEVGVAMGQRGSGQLLLTYPSRHTWMHPLPNAYLLAAVVAGIGIQIAAAVLPAASNLLGNAAIPLELWGLVFGGALLAWGSAEAIARVAWRDRPRA